MAIALGALTLACAGAGSEGRRGRPGTNAGAPAKLPGPAAPAPGPAAPAGADAAPDQTQRPAASPIPGLRGIDHVVIGVNDLEGAAGAYRRLGFTVLPFGPRVNDGPTRLVDLRSGFLELVTAPRDSAGQPGRYPLEGAIAQSWEVDLGSAAGDLEGRGVTLQPVQPGGFGSDAREGVPAWREVVPDRQPVSGTSLLFVDYMGAGARTQFESRLEEASVADPLDHENGAEELAYVTVAVSQLANPLEVLRSWGIEPGDPVRDVRGSLTVAVDLPGGRLYLTTPLGGGGISDFLEERRAQAPPLGDRYFEGSILSIGVGVRNLDETEEFFQTRSIPYVPMELPSGRTLVVQGAPGWGLRLEFVDRQKGVRARRWMAHRDPGDEQRDEPEDPSRGDNR